MRKVCLSLGLLIFLSGAAQAPETLDDLRIAADAAKAAGSTDTAWVTYPIWTRRPSTDDIDETNPIRGSRRSKGGGAMLICRIGDGGEFKLCLVDREQPSGERLGTAALKLSKLFKMKANDEKGAPVAGRLIAIPIAYRP
jgi:hypothetical protein